jgi:hypothetical protein
MRSVAPSGTSKMYTAFFDRNEHTILGRFSIRKHTGEYVVEKLIARSGQHGYTKSSWNRGKSPIPYGRFNLHTTPNNRGQEAGAFGIGEFYPIDTQGDRLTIRDPENYRRKRMEIGLHEENGLPGSAGCIVIVYHSDWLLVREFLRSVADEHPTLPVEVL